MIVRGRALDYRFEVATDDASLHDFFAATLLHLVKDADQDVGRPVRIHVSRLDRGAISVRTGEHVIYTGAPTPAVARVMNVINVGATRSAGSDPILHSGVVAFDGRAVIVPGRPGAGKSTTTTALLLRGFDYLSDETGPIRPDLRITPYPKPVVIGRGSWPAVPEAARGRVDLACGDLDAWWLDPALLGAGVVTAPLSVGAVAVPQYRAGARLQIEELSRGEATTVMASNMFNLQQHGIAGISRIADMCDGAARWRLTFGRVEDVCAFLQKELA